MHKALSQAACGQRISLQVTLSHDAPQWHLVPKPGPVQALRETHKILSQVDILGSPIVLGASLAAGLQSFVREPLKARNPVQFVVGLGHGSRALLQLGTYGLFNAVSQVGSCLCLAQVRVPCLSCQELGWVISPPRLCCSTAPTASPMLSLQMRCVLCAIRVHQVRRVRWGAFAWAACTCGV